MANWHIRLKGVSPLCEGKNWESNIILRVGRVENSDIFLNDPSISRRHAEVVATEQGWIIRDVGSTNGTFLNGVRIGRGDRRLRQRDVLQFGNIVVIVQMLDEPQPQINETPSQNLEVQATTSFSWERAIESAASLDMRMSPRSGDRLLTLLRAGHHLCHISSLDTLLRSILDDAVLALDAQRGAIVLYHEKNDQLQLRQVSTGTRETTSRVCFSRSLAQRCFDRAESVLCRDVTATPDLMIANSIADGAMSSIICAVLRSPRKKLGIIHLDRGPLQEPFNRDDLKLADALAASVSAAIESAQLLEKQKDFFLQTVTALAQAVEMRDRYTGGHTQRVTDYAIIIAEQLHLSAEEMHHIQIGTPLHDIGKIGIDDSILRKPGKLTEAEFEMMKTHTTKGAIILETIPDMGHIIPIVRNHHESWDGNGYPDRLVGEKIPYLARIVAVADAFDAMTSNRPYRKGLPIETAIHEIQTRAGQQFDPNVVQAFTICRTKIEEVRLERMAAEVADLHPAYQVGLVNADDSTGPPTASISNDAVIAQP